MASLAEQIDRLNSHARAMKIVASETSQKTVAGPFTRALLDPELGDLIRDIDPSELGLFNLVNPQKNGVHDLKIRGFQTTKIKRVEFHGTTPLRKPGLQRDEAKPQDINPEVYLHAALEYIDRYQPIRAMPRALTQATDIMQKLNEVRTNLERLKATHEDPRLMEVTSMKTQIESEEEHINALRARLDGLQKRKQAVSIHTTRFTEKSPRLRVEPAASPQEDKFWTTPTASSRAFRFEDNLLDEDVNIDDVSATSFSSPPRDYLSSQLEGDVFNLEEIKSTNIHLLPEVNNTGTEQEVGTIAEEPISLSNAPPEVSPMSTTTGVKPDVSSHANQRSKIKITSEVERIIIRIWSTVGDVITRGHRFNAASTTDKLPLAKETIALLQQLSASSPICDSPTTASSISTMSSANSSPTFQQILTAHLLLSLLKSSPPYTMSLHHAKELLAAKAKLAGDTADTVGQGVTRVLYGCVAKRLIKIDRGGGEQTVKFDLSV